MRFPAASGVGCCGFVHGFSEFVLVMIIRFEILRYGGLVFLFWGFGVGLLLDCFSVLVA